MLNPSSVFILGLLGASAAFGWLLIERRESAKTAREPGVGADDPLPLPADLPLVSVVVPARNEERSIRGCVESLLAQRYPRLQVIVVDDESTDATGAILADLAGRCPGLTVIRGEPLPPGWIGKNYALHQGVKAARGEWILFTDADTLHQPEAAGRALAYAVAHGIDLLSLAAGQECRGFWERAVQPVVFQLLGLRFSFLAVNDPRSPVAAANGQYILVRRGAYERIGGHEAIGGVLLEDVALARRAKAAGLRIHFAHAPGLIRARMYSSLGAIWQGWTKNLFALADRRAGTTLLAMGFLLWGAVLPYATLGAAAAQAWRTGWGLGAVALFVLSAAAATVILAVQARLRGRSGFRPGDAWTHPVGSSLVAAALAASWLAHAAGRGAVWKGRRYR